MTAHVIFKDLDPFNSVTLSPKMIEIIRKFIKFKGIIISDDICMKALSKIIYIMLKKHIVWMQSGIVLYGNSNESSILLKK